PAGELADLAVLFVNQLHELEQLEGRRARGLRLEPVVARVDEKVVEDGDLLVEVVLLRDDPIRDFTQRGCSVTGIPSTSSRPEVGGSAHEIIRIVVVLPAPFGPRKPKHVSAGTSKLIERTASRSR